MGGKQGKCTVANLNYSGIYLSPFQYYGIDNWQQLERIGRIFEQQLREDYYKIKQKSHNLGGQSFLEEQYDRNTFRWNIGDIDKDIHSERYSPLYTSNQNITNSNFAGIVKKNNKQWLANQSQFFQEWQQTFAAIQQQTKNFSNQVVKTATSSKNFQKYQCCMLDFLCYKSIVLYIYANLTKESNVYIDFLHSQKYQSFQKITQKTQKNFNQAQMIKEYKSFMHKYFQRIDTKTKIQITLQAFFHRKGPDIIVFTQATSELRLQIQKQNNFKIYGPFDKNRVKQTLLLVKRNLPFRQIQHQFLSQQFTKHLYSYDLQRIYRKINEKQNISLLKIQLEKFMKQYFEEASRIQLNKLLTQIQANPKPALKKLCQYFDKFKIDSIKASLEIQLNKYVPKIFKYWKQKGKNDTQYESQIVKKFADKLKNQGILCWTNDVIFAKFKDYRQKSVIIGGFHLSSKPQINGIQVQILGLIIHHLLTIKQCNFIFAGDFNSQISLRSKDSCHGIFQMAQQLLNLPDQQIKRLSNNVNRFPRLSKIITTKKKRTILQPQVRKANELAEKCIDLVLTTYPIENQLSHVCQIGKIDKGQFLNQNFLPHKQHPYDHFLVQTTLDLNQKN